MPEKDQLQDSELNFWTLWESLSVAPREEALGVWKSIRTERADWDCERMNCEGCEEGPQGMQTTRS